MIAIVDTVAQELNHEELFLMALKEQLPSLRRCSDKQVVDKAGKAQLKEAVEAMTDYVDAACGELNRNETFSMYTQMLKHLTSFMTESMNMPITLTTVITHMSLLAHAVNQAFPGYAEFGLLKSIITPRKLQLVKNASETFPLLEA